MFNVTYKHKTLSRDPDQTLLDCLLDAGFELPYGCRSGVCQSCVMHVAQPLPDQGEGLCQQGLSQAQIDAGCLLPCQSKPRFDISLADSPPQFQQRLEGTLSSKRWLSKDVLGIVIEVESGPVFRRGQFVTLWRDEATGRSYSLADCSPGGPELPGACKTWRLECHVRVIPGGAVSQWLADQLEPGDQLTVRGPMGACTYQAETDHRLMLLASGTGLAPIAGIARDAVLAGHQGHISLLYAAREVAGFYYLDELASLVRELANVECRLLVQTPIESGNTSRFESGDVYQASEALLREQSYDQLYVCGSENFCARIRRSAYLAGLPLAAIHADAFLDSARG